MSPTAPVTGVNTYTYNTQFDVSLPADGTLNGVTVTFHNRTA